MYKNMDYKDTYCNPESGNIRYRSDAKDSINGWAYVFTQDNDYVRDLLEAGHKVQVRVGDWWGPYRGHLPTTDDMEELNNDLIRMAYPQDEWGI